MSKTKTTASELADAKQYFETAIRYPINGGEKYGLIIATELRRLEEENGVLGLLHVEQETRIAELEAENEILMLRIDVEFGI